VRLSHCLELVYVLCGEVERRNDEEVVAVAVEAAAARVWEGRGVNVVSEENEEGSIH